MIRIFPFINTISALVTPKMKEKRLNFCIKMQRNGIMMLYLHSGSIVHKTVRTTVWNPYKVEIDLSMLNDQHVDHNGYVNSEEATQRKLERHKTVKLEFQITDPSAFEILITIASRISHPSQIMIDLFGKSICKQKWA